MVSASTGTLRLLTISVDDGHPLDLRTADLLAKYGLKATFYVPAKNPERPVMDPATLRELATRFELGGHTYNHVPLEGLPAERVAQEVRGGRDWLDDLLGIPSRSFCYPRGAVDGAAARAAADAGYVGARTCRLNLTRVPRNPFMVGVSTQAHAHSRLVQVRHALVEGNVEGAVRFAVVHRLAVPWDEHFLHAVDWVERHGGVAHLYLHSWEVDADGRWDALERVLRDAASRRNLTPVTNGTLFELVRERGAARRA